MATPNKSGDIARGFFVKDHFYEITAISTFEYLIDILVTLLIPLFGLFFVYGSFLDEIKLFYILLGIVSILLFTGYRMLSGKNIIEKSAIYKRYQPKIHQLITPMKTGFSNKNVLFSGVLITLFYHGTYFAVFYLILRNLGAGTTVLETVFAAGVGFIVGSMTFMPMGIGTRDISSYGMLVSLGTDSELAITAVTIMRSLSITLMIISGLCYFNAVRKIGS